MSRPRAASRTVRFAEQDVIVMDNRTPSPSHSSSTLSSPELSSPPTLPPYPLPSSPVEGLCGGRLPSPMEGRGLELDQSLMIPPPNRLPLFTYDLTRSPHGSSSHGIVPPLPQAALLRPAVTPPIAKMSIVVKTEAFRWSMDIKPKYSGREYVTVQDVLYGMYDDLQIRMDRAEMATLPTEVQQSLGIACQKRCERLRRKEKRDEAAEGTKRVDCLYNTHRFAGIVFDSNLGAWVLVADEQP